MPFRSCSADVYWKDNKRAGRTPNPLTNTGSRINYGNFGAASSGSHNPFPQTNHPMKMQPQLTRHSFLMMLLISCIISLFSQQCVAAAAKGIIAFMSDRNSKPPNLGVTTTIYLINADGTNEQEWLKNDRCGFYHPPTWSPDGQKIAFSTCDANGSIHIFVKDLRTSKQKKVTDIWTGIYPGYLVRSWSGDGKLLALSCWEVPPHDSSDICIIDVEGKRLKNLTQLPGVGDWTPSWSPDSSKIVFGSRRDGNDEIYVMEADGRNPVNLTNHPSWDSSADWSPDGEKIVFFSHREGQSDIYVMDADGANVVNLTNHPAQDRVPSWSPNGQWIAFQSTRDRNWEIYVMEADGNNQTRVTNHPDTDVEPVWVIPNRSLPVDTQGNHVTLWGQLKSDKQ